MEFEPKNEQEKPVDAGRNYIEILKTQAKIEKGVAFDRSAWAMGVILGGLIFKGSGSDLAGGAMLALGCGIGASTLMRYGMGVGMAEMANSLEHIKGEEK